jgi:preprotein translocase subunit SecD
VTVRAGESPAAARARLEGALRGAVLPPGRALAFGRLNAWDAGARGADGVPQGWRSYVLETPAQVGNAHVADAQVATDELSGVSVLLRFTAEGSSKFEQLTAKNTKRRLAIVLDGIVESAPLIQTPIAGGKASITMGKGSAEEQLRDARQLELVLRSGELAAPVVLAAEEAIAAP